MGVRVLELLEDAPHLVDFLSTNVLLACERGSEPLPILVLGLVTLPFLLQPDPGAKEGLQECLLRADLGIEELFIVQLLQVQQLSVSMVGGLEHRVGASRPTVWDTAGDPDVIEMAHLEDCIAVRPTQEKVRKAKGYLLLADALDAFALA